MKYYSDNVAAVDDYQGPVIQGIINYKEDYCDEILTFLQ